MSGAPRPAILLPPSKGQRPGGGGPPWSPGVGAVPALDEARGKVLDALVAAVGRGRFRHPDLAVLLDATGPTQTAARDAARAVRRSPTRPAIERYDGVLYRELDYASQPPVVRRRLDEMVLIFTAALGVVAPRDPVPEHRLAMGVSLPALARTGGSARLATWWRPRLTAALAEHLAGRVVWDLLPGEHAAAWDPSTLPAKARFTVRFLDSGGRPVSHWNKLLKGALVAWLGASAACELDELEGFSHPLGYQWDPDATETEAWGARVVFREK